MVFPDGEEELAAPVDEVVQEEGAVRALTVSRKPALGGAHKTIAMWFAA